MSLLKKGTKAYSMIKMKCPRCNEGDLFKTATYSFKLPFEMYDRCPVCNQNYLPEPGFYYGAMFISYIIWGWMCLAMAGLFIWGMGMSVNGGFALILLISAVFFVWLFRFSRSIWISINVKYKPNQKQR